MKIRIFSLIVVLFTSAASANVRLPKLFGSGMVLQRDKPIPVWGWADQGEKVTVKFQKQTKTVRAAKDGSWKVELAATEAGGPYQLAINGKNAIVLSDVLVGDVWVCSGQSNMEWPLSSSMNANDEIKAANYPQIRHLEVPKAIAYEPKNDLTGPTSWKAANPENVGKFTAVGYFFAQKLHKELNVPIGLIHTSWGGTDVETWMSRESAVKVGLIKLSSDNKNTSAEAELALKQRQEQIKNRIQELQGGFPDKASVDKWKAASFDDSKWPELSVPQLWEEQALPDFDGVVWLRKTINLSAQDVGKAALLELSRIDDSDDTYVNGVRVGSKNVHTDIRTYPVSSGLLKEGKNVIAVRVKDNAGGGGIYGNPDEVRLTIENKVYPLAGEWQFQAESLLENSGNSANAGNPNSYPTLLYNGMIQPLIPFAIKGAIWYQGENNAGRAYQYRSTFPAMISDWRKQWGQGDFPFYFVQLASWKALNGNSEKGSSWAELREAQALTLATPNTGMAVTIDIGDTEDIHPRNKQDVGKRLAAVALNKTYNKGNEYSGPVYDTIQIKEGGVLLSFKHTTGGLMAKDSYGYVKGFEIAGADKKFYYAKADIVGDKIFVSNENVSNPVAIRYAWADDAKEANLYNKEGFPAAPFRTDQWKGVTEEETYVRR